MSWGAILLQLSRSCRRSFGEIVILYIEMWTFIAVFRANVAWLEYGQTVIFVVDDTFECLFTPVRRCECFAVIIVMLLTHLNVKSRQ